LTIFFFCFVVGMG